ncbi:hypothetical protein GFS31_00970 [Leptolyngbya sp. BL0902]|uniref:AIPR family protein n=1 Tax=Leptolyngbya sp. BL0902 TaxID=1115757 RepID=UPI0018E6FD9A|nr:AIPR family protein [Leptolyngbya sp. BL0902]QQE63432.1 hypothetical protein GFS31_00970 [Leptolyngbya sp. BL0902]
MNKLPDFLENYIDFKQHIDQTYKDFSNVEKGKHFAELAKDTLNSHDDFIGLESYLNPKSSHDNGVDIFWKSPDSNQYEFFCQSKYQIRGKDELDSVISKFKDFDEKLNSHNSTELGQQLELINKKEIEDERKNPEGDYNKLQTVKYVIVTLWKLDRIIDLYEKTNRPSLQFYKKLVNEGRLEIIDGIKFYEYFLKAYQKEYAIPQEVRFRVVDKLANKHNVYVGIMNSKDLIEIYKTSGNGIFFENVRDFLGIGSKKDSSFDINSEIYKTAHDDPSKMIERNNGITFKANALTYEGGEVVLRNAGIINGCQTTICIAKAQPDEDCYVPVKIVITSDEQTSSDIARTANTQNRIDKINLELSDFIRPQLIKSSLAEIGVRLEDDEASQTAPRVAAFISNQRIFKSDLRYLFIGLFSTTPRNIFASDYASIRFDDIRLEFSSIESKKELNSLLARLIICSNNAFEKLRQKYPSEDKDGASGSPEKKVGKVFNRFYVDQKGYKAYLTVLSVYFLLELYDEVEIKNLPVTQLTQSISSVVDQRREDLENSLCKIFKAVAMVVINHFSEKNKDLESKDLESEVSQYLSKYIARTKMSAYCVMYGMLET